MSEMAMYPNVFVRLTHQQQEELEARVITEQEQFVENVIQRMAASGLTVKDGVVYHDGDEYRFNVENWERSSTELQAHFAAMSFVSSLIGAPTSDITIAQVN